MGVWTAASGNPKSRAARIRTSVAAARRGATAGSSLTAKSRHCWRISLDAGGSPYSPRAHRKLPRVRAMGFRLPVQPHAVRSPADRPADRALPARQGGEIQVVAGGCPGGCPLGGAVWAARVLSRPATAPGAWCWDGCLPGGRRAALNLIVITLDTTRADHLGAYGAAAAATPALDALAEEGVLFEQAMTTAPLTLPAHSSIFTGKFPPEHGVRDNGGFFLGPEQVTLAEVMKAARLPHRRVRRGLRPRPEVGHRAGIRHLLRRLRDDGAARRQVRRRHPAAGQRDGRRRAAVDRVRSQVSPSSRGSTSTTPHTPYAPPEPFKSRFPGDPYSGEIAFIDAQIGRVIEFLWSQRPAGIAPSSRSSATTARASASTARTHARLLRLRGRHARSLHRPRARSRGRRPPRGGPGSRGGPDAHRARPAGSSPPHLASLASASRRC